MFQPICRLMLLILLLFAGALIGLRAALFHAPPANDEAGRFVLSDCAMPCWQGIQPGVTRIDDAILLLNSNPWVKGLQIVERPPSTYLYWDWSAVKPRFAGDPHALIPPEMWGQNGVIQLIFIPTSLAYGEVSLLLGAPNRGLFAVSSTPNPLTLATHPNTQHLAVYFGGSVSFGTRLVCPVNLDLFWNAPVSIAYIDDALVRSQSIFDYDLAHWLYSQPCNA
ncbi:MAG: hypothetical protein ABI700_13265 [Chloroflexota bacterium]